MGARVAFGWLEDVVRAAWNGDAIDCEDWLACRDDALQERQNERRHATVARLGVKVG